MAAVAGSEPIIWFIESHDPADLEPSELAEWIRTGTFRFALAGMLGQPGPGGNPRERLGEASQGLSDHPRFARTTGISSATNAEDEEDHHPMLLRDVALSPTSRRRCAAPL
jgi:hypothetical protein